MTVAFDTLFVQEMVYHGQTAPFYGNDIPDVEAAVQGYTSGTVYLDVVDSGAVFATQHFVISSQSATMFPLRFIPNTALPTGTYTGNLQFVFCRDSACTSRIGTGASLPYNVLIAAIKIEAYVNGVDVGNMFGSGDIDGGTVPAGTVVEFKNEDPMAINEDPFVIDDYPMDAGQVGFDFDQTNVAGDEKGTLTVPSGTTNFDATFRIFFTTPTLQHAESHNLVLHLAH